MVMSRAEKKRATLEECSESSGPSLSGVGRALRESGRDDAANFVVAAFSCRGCFLAGGITHRCLGIFRSYAGTVWFLSLIFIHGKSNADVGSDFLTNRMLCEKEAYSVVLWPVVYQAGSPKILTSKPRIHQRETSFKRTVHSQCSNRRVLYLPISSYVPRCQL